LDAGDPFASAMFSRARGSSLRLASLWPCVVSVVYGWTLKEMVAAAVAFQGALCVCVCVFLLISRFWGIFLYSIEAELIMETLWEKTEIFGVSK
jgi:hypothetical protein